MFQEKVLPINLSKNLLQTFASQQRKFLVLIQPFICLFFSCWYLSLHSLSLHYKFKKPVWVLLQQKKTNSKPDDRVGRVGAPRS